MSCVHYKYKNSLDYDTITFDGLHISLSDLRQAIATQKKIGKSSDFMLQVVNAQTSEEYKGENTLIPRNASVIVRRVPVGAGGSEDSGSHAAESQAKPTDLSKMADLSKAVGSEEEKMIAMMTQSTEEYDPSKYQKVRYRGTSSQYVCYRCNKPGHHIRNCPMNGIKRATGIPQIFMKQVENANVPGAMLTAGGQLAVPVIDSAAYRRGKKATANDFPAGAKVAAAPVIAKVERKTPDEMICPLCRKLMSDAVLIPCCGRSYCDDCIRNYLLENRFVCPEPDCKQTDVSPDNLIPNRSLRKAIDNFRNGVPGTKGVSGLKASQLDARQVPAEKSAAASSEVGDLAAESVSKNSELQKKLPVGGDVSRDSTPEADPVPSNVQEPPPSDQPRPDAVQHRPPPMGAPMMPPMPAYGPPRAVPMYSAVVDVPAHVIPYPRVLPPVHVPVPMPMPFPGPQPAFPGQPVGPVLGLDPGLVGPLDDPPPMSVDQFYRQQLQMRKQVGYSSRSSSRSSGRSSRSSTPSSQWSSRSSSWSRSRSSSRSLSYSPKRHHHSRHHGRSRSRSISPSRRHRRHRSSPSSRHRHQSGLHRHSKHHQVTSKRTGRHRRRRRRSVSRSRSPARRHSRSPRYSGSRSGSRTGRKTEQRSKHKKRSRSLSPLDVRPTKKEKVSKHSRGAKGEWTQLSRKDVSKSPQREKKRAKVEKVNSSKIVTKVRKFREKKEDKVATPPRLDKSHTVARMNEQFAGAGESGFAMEAQSPESDYRLKEEYVQSSRIDMSKSPQREKRATVEKVPSKEVVTKVRKFHEKKEEKVATPPRVDRPHRAARMNEQLADTSESDLVTESQSAESDYMLSTKPSMDAADSQLSESYEEEGTVPGRQHSARKTELSASDVIKREPQSLVESGSDRHATKTQTTKIVKKKLVDTSARASAGMLKAAVLGAVADAKQQKTKSHSKPAVKSLASKETKKKQRYNIMSADKPIPKIAVQPECALSAEDEGKKTSTSTAEVETETTLAPKYKKKVVIRRQNVLKEETTSPPVEKRPCLTDSPVDTQDTVVQEPQVKDGSALAKSETVSLAGDTRIENAEEEQESFVFQEKSDVLDAEAGPETEPSVEVDESESHEVRHKSKTKKKKHHKHHKHHRRHSKSKSSEITEGSREETGDSDNHVEASETHS